MEDNQDRRNILEEIKLAALSILERIKSADPVDGQNAMQEYAALVDRFNEVSEHLAPHQHKAAKQDVEYFLRLLDLAIRYSATGDQG